MQRHEWRDMSAETGDHACTIHYDYKEWIDRDNDHAISPHMYTQPCMQARIWIALITSIVLGVGGVRAHRHTRNFDCGSGRMLHADVA